MLTFEALRTANVARDQEWDPENKIDMAFREAELVGELGEFYNVLKKLQRERLGIRGSRATQADLEDELADVAICVDLMAMELGIDLAAAIQRKFNATSVKYDLAVKL